MGAQYQMCLWSPKVTREQRSTTTTSTPQPPPVCPVAPFEIALAGHPTLTVYDEIVSLAMIALLKELRRGHTKMRVPFKRPPLPT